MNPYAYRQATSAETALAAIHGMADTSKFIAGGTNLLDLMKENVLRPAQLVDINRLALSDIALLPDTDSAAPGGLSLGALARNADTAYHPLVRTLYPLLNAAILAGASPQIRNMASNGGNLLQRTRCYYFYDTGTACNKRSPGSGCSALQGLTRIHAILGAEDNAGGQPHCIATHPSDMCVALAALDATVHVRSANGARSIGFADFHRLPAARPEIDTQIAPDELITHIVLPAAPQFAAHSAYLKLRDRASYAFALVSVAAALDLDRDGNVRDARIALGGVAHKPWRLREAEMLLAGQPPSARQFALAAQLLLSGARSYGAENDNAYKIPMARRAVVRALQMAAAGIRGNKVNDPKAGVADQAMDDDGQEVAP